MGCSQLSVKPDRIFFCIMKKLSSLSKLPYKHPIEMASVQGGYHSFAVYM